MKNLFPFFTLFTFHFAARAQTKDYKNSTGADVTDNMILGYTGDATVIQ
ncbi:hypothetical protein [Mucilaginibacter xinganensis]|uniref:Uncharacterized protein n=1 Tax=Mucilaginibacter xinganensis TaxID=1234841 RepID=A0A223NX68_9SPHI|nr:hypothetical protein [Mucilaginibacter xinganensis]ASU34151.1 hypothetical protein MuYL_2262 [Mucilaginibacter xinganensis]